MAVHCPMCRCCGTCRVSALLGKVRGLVTPSTDGSRCRGGSRQPIGADCTRDAAAPPGRPPSARPVGGGGARRHGRSSGGSGAPVLLASRGRRTRRVESATARHRTGDRLLCCGARVGSSWCERGAAGLVRSERERAQTGPVTGSRGALVNPCSFLCRHVARP